MKKMTKKPLISILMNCFNGDKFLYESLTSVLNQTYENWELIFWDNKSTDSSREIISTIKDRRIKIFLSNKHTNLGQARNNAYQKVKGDYLAFLDVDDIWEANKLSNQIKVFEDKEVGISFTNVFYFSNKRKEILYKTKKDFTINTNSLITNYSLSLNSIMLDINKLNKLSYDFDPIYSNISDFDLIVRLSTISKVKYLNKVLSCWRIHGNNQSFKKKELFNEEQEIWCKYHLRNNYLTEYKSKIKELNNLILAKQRILKNSCKINNIKFANIKSTSNIRNKLFIIFSYIPFLPKFLYQIKDYLFKLKWY